jgi:7tm Chemosensory receptor
LSEERTSSHDFQSMTVTSSTAQASSSSEKLKASQDDYVRQIQQNTVYALFRPFLVIMRISGIFFVQPKALHLHLEKMLKLSPRTLRESAEKDHWKWEWFERCSKVYCITAFLLVWTLGAKFIYSFKFGVEKLAFSQANLGHIVNHSAYAISVVHVVSTHFLFLQACWNEKKMFSLFKNWDRLHFTCPFPAGSCLSFADNFRWRRNILFTLLTCNIILQVSSWIFPLIIPYSGYSDLKYSLLEGFGMDNIPVTILDVVGGMYSALVFIVPSYFFHMIGLALSINFRHLSHDLSLSIQNDGRMASSGKSIEWFRLRHSCLCNLVELADGIFSPWILLNIGCCTVQVLAGIFIIYALSDSFQLLTTLSASFWILIYFLQVILTLYTGAIVHVAVCTLPYPTRTCYTLHRTTL